MRGDLAQQCKRDMEMGHERSHRERPADEKRKQLSAKDIGDQMTDSREAHKVVHEAGRTRTHEYSH